MLVQLSHCAGDAHTAHKSYVLLEVHHAFLEVHAWWGLMRLHTHVLTQSAKSAACVSVCFLWRDAWTRSVRWALIAGTRGSAAGLFNTV